MTREPSTSERGDSVALSAVGLEKRFTTGTEVVEVLRGVDLELRGGQSLAVTGPSGSGKSSLLHILGTLDRPSAGEVTLAGVAPFSLDEPALARFRNASIGFVFQDHHLLPHYSVLENVLLPTLAQPGDEGAEARAHALLERVGLSHRLSHRPAQISGGERQRTAVARALINQPALLLCDEPTGSLDRKSADAVAKLLLDLHAEGGAVLIVVTHDLALAGRFDRHLELRDGRLQAPDERADA